MSKDKNEAGATSHLTQMLEFTGYCTLLAVEMIMSYQIKDEDLQKGITLQLTAEQLDIIAGALESVCISLGEKNDPYLGYVAEAQEAIIEVLESNFGVEV